MNTVTVSRRFQIVIPAALRKQLRLVPGTQMMVVDFNGIVRLMPLRPAATLRGIARGVVPTVLRDPDRL